MRRLVWVMAATMVSGGAGIAGQSRQPARPSVDVQKALRDGGLHAAAIAAGGVYRAKDDEPAAPAIRDLKALVSVSDAIVIGEALESEAHLVRRDQAITTDFRMQVIEIPRGTQSPGDVVVLRLPGGRIEFRDGTVAEMSSSYPPVHNGGRFVMFLRKVPGGELSPAASTWAHGATVFAPAAGLVSLMASAPDGTVDFEGRRDPIARAYRGKSAREFMQDLRGLLQAAR